MPLNGTLIGQARIVALLGGAGPHVGAAQEKFYIEDGWVFREHHGKYVECICRSEDISTSPAQLLPIKQLA